MGKQKNLIPAFLQKTYDIVDNPNLRHIVCWKDGDTAFIVKNTKLFQDVILPQYFKHKNYTSFVRQLNMYDFHKTKGENNENVFSHKVFKQGCRDQLYLIQRKEVERPLIRKSGVNGKRYKHKHLVQNSDIEKKKMTNLKKMPFEIQSPVPRAQQQQLHQQTSSQGGMLSNANISKTITKTQSDQMQQDKEKAVINRQQENYNQSMNMLLQLQQQQQQPQIGQPQLQQLQQQYSNNLSSDSFVKVENSGNQGSQYNSSFDLDSQQALAYYEEERQSMSLKIEQLISMMKELMQQNDKFLETSKCLWAEVFNFVKMLKKKNIRSVNIDKLMQIIGEIQNQDLNQNQNINSKGQKENEVTSYNVADRETKMRDYHEDNKKFLVKLGNQLQQITRDTLQFQMYQANAQQNANIIQQTPQEDGISNCSTALSSLRNPMNITHGVIGAGPQQIQQQQQYQIQQSAETRQPMQTPCFISTIPFQQNASTSNFLLTNPSTTTTSPNYNFTPQQQPSLAYQNYFFQQQQDINNNNVNVPQYYAQQFMPQFQQQAETSDYAIVSPGHKRHLQSQNSQQQLADINGFPSIFNYSSNDGLNNNVPTGGFYGNISNIGQFNNSPGQTLETDLNLYQSPMWQQPALLQQNSQNEPYPKPNPIQFINNPTQPLIQPKQEYLSQKEQDHEQEETTHINEEESRSSSTSLCDIEGTKIVKSEEDLFGNPIKQI